MIIRLLHHAAAWLPCFVLVAAIVVALSSKAFGDRDPACDAQPFDQCAALQAMGYRCAIEEDSVKEVPHCVDCDGDGIYHKLKAITANYTCFKTDSDYKVCQKKNIYFTDEVCTP